MLAETLVIAALRGPAPAWPAEADNATLHEALRIASDNGVCSLLHDKLAGSGWPAKMLDALRDHAVRAAMWELSHQHALGSLLRVLQEAGVTPVLIKGTSLAYSLYGNPALRTRGDTDLLIAPTRHAQVHGLLLGQGYETRVAVEGEFISYQAAYVRRSRDGGEHTLDVHWKINNSELLSHLFTHEELLEDAQPLPALCPYAWGASPVHALLIACMHRSTHRQNPYYIDGEAHHDADRLIWLYDIHLLAGHLSEAEWAKFVRLALHKGLAAVCLEGMQHAAARFDTRYPPDVELALSQAIGEAPFRYLAAGHMRQRWMDFVALGGPARRLRFARELFFPAPGYMRTKYPLARWRWLPWLYLRRAGGGLVKSIMRRHVA
jgi:hypothetical protein